MITLSSHRLRQPKSSITSDKGNTVNKAELIEAVAARTGTSKVAAAEAVDAFLDAVIGATAKGDKVAIAGFGNFSKGHRKSRTGREGREEGSGEEGREEEVTVSPQSGPDDSYRPGPIALFGDVPRRLG